MSELDPLGRTPLAEGMKRKIAEALAEIPPEKRAVLLVVATKPEQGQTELRAQFAARINGTWKIAAGGGFAFTPDKPLSHGWFGIEKTW